MDHGGRGFLPHRRRLHAVCFLERIRNVSTIPVFATTARVVWKYRAGKRNHFAVIPDYELAWAWRKSSAGGVQFPRRDKIHQSGRTRSLTNTWTFNISLDIVARGTNTVALKKREIPRDVSITTSTLLRSSASWPCVIKLFRTIKRYRNKITRAGQTIEEDRTMYFLSKHNIKCLWIREKTYPLPTLVTCSYSLSAIDRKLHKYR